MFKSEIRILGFDDAAFEFEDKKKNKSRPVLAKRKVPVIGVIFRGGNFLDGALRTDVTIDGLDATDRLIELINKTRHKRQLRVVMFDGITLGGFNIIDIQRLHKETGLPMIVFNRKMPDLKRVKKALKNFKDYRKRWVLIEKAGKVKDCKIRPRGLPGYSKEARETKKVYYQSFGLTDEETGEIIALSCTHGHIPEPLRAAHIIATAIVKGESSGRA